MSVLSHLDHGFGSHIHSRMWQSWSNDSNNLFSGAFRALIDIAKKGNLENFYVRKKDGLRWKEDLLLVGTSIGWSWLPLIANIAVLPVAPVATFLSGIYLLSALSVHNNFVDNFLVIGKSLAVMTVGTLIMTLYSIGDVVRAIPVVGHLLRMIYKLLDGQYKLPRTHHSVPNEPGDVPPINNPVVDAAISSGDSAPLLPLTNNLLRQAWAIAQVRWWDRALAEVAYSGFNQLFFQRQRQLAQPLSKAPTEQNIAEYAEIYDEHHAALTDMTADCELISSDDLILLADFMNALYAAKQCSSRERSSYLINVRSSAFKIKNIDIFECIQIVKDQELFKRLKVAFATENPENSKVATALQRKLEALALNLSSANQECYPERSRLLVAH